MKATEGPEGTNRLPEIIEGVQYPGETIFVPGNWWHGVQNLDLTIAITQNFVNEGNFEKVWLRCRRGRKKLSVRFLAKLKTHYPELYRKAVDMNKRDNFVMWDKREEYRAKFAKKAKTDTENVGDGAAAAESSCDTISSESAGDNRDGNNIDAGTSDSDSAESSNHEGE